MITSQEQLLDEEVVKQIQDGHKEAMAYILNKYKPMVKHRARGLFIIGGEPEDLIQEGMVGLFEAISQYSPEHEASFKSFAEICVTRQIYTAIQASQRKKHGPLNSYVSISGDVTESERLIEPALSEQLPVQMSAEDQVVDKESTELLFRKLTEKLSSLERKVMELYLSGMDYTEIADNLGKPSKSIDNALQRIKTKAKELVIELSS